MPQLYLASSALIDEEYEGNRTIEEALKAGFSGVQLFLDPRYRDALYRDSVLKNLQQSKLSLVLHLPNIVTSEDIHAAQEVVAQFPDSKLLIHYLPETALPAIKGTKVGWENSKIGPVDKDMQEYLNQLQAKIKNDDTFYVFDVVRLLYAQEEQKNMTVNYIREELVKLDPDKDIIHLADKTSWDLRFRECMCTLGDGLMAEFIEEMKKYRGIIVFEYENLDMARHSFKVL